MPVQTISAITNVIVNILQNTLSSSGLFGSITVYPDLPIRQDQIGLGFYLYHVLENAQYKNSLPPGNDTPPVNYTPMGLNLYYQLSANNPAVDSKSSLLEQDMMSVAMKALHDNAEIQLVTQDWIRISLQPTAATDAVHNWTAGPYALKLSAFYEVSVVFLVPEVSKSYVGRVLTYGNYIFTESTPRIAQSENLASFRIPGESNDRQIVVQPAQATYGDNIDFTGSGFAGQNLELLLVGNTWDGTALADKAAWSIKTTGAEKLTATIQKTAVLQSTGLPVNVLPGMYGAQINAPRTISFPDGTVRKLPNVSNIFPFIITPQIAIPPVVAGTNVTVTGYPFLDPTTLSPLNNMQVYIGDILIDLVPAAGFVAGTYIINTLTQLKIFLPAILTAGKQYSLRILIGGAESRPIWITA